MESKKRMEQLQTDVKQLIEDEERGSSSTDGFLAVVKDGDEIDERSPLLSKLLSQLESLEDVMLDKQSGEEKEIGSKHESTKDGCSCSCEVGKEEIIKELRKVRRQNLVTHCLVSVMIVLTVAWQLSEVSLLLKVKEGLSHPFKSLGGIVKGMLKRPGLDSQELEKQASGKQNPVIQAAALPGLKIPELPHVELPAFDFEGDDD